ncbi:type VII secretion target [Actinoplanes sp. NPDC023801]|uniref:type VII secretion target n=1 Tax=Actinoplanes sp. NPDC023801 TaxID=3154595 RepID=UPI0033D8BE1D
MSDGFTADPAQIRAHTAKVAAIRERFGAITAASAAITRDDAAYGLLCGWMAGILDERLTAQRSIHAYVEENLRLAEDSLIRTAREYDDADTAAANRIRDAGNRR